MSAPSNLEVSVLFFAQARDRAGRDRVIVEMPPGTGLADLVAHLRREYPGLEPLWPHLAIALDGVLADPATPLRHGAEVALLPPVSGG